MAAPVPELLANADSPPFSAVHADLDMLYGQRLRCIVPWRFREDPKMPSKILVVVSLLAALAACGSERDTSGAVPATCESGTVTCGYRVPAGVGAYCGDGQIDPSTEQCDDGNTQPGDGCSGTCKAEPNWVCPPEGGACTWGIACGDSKRDPGEQCDDGNQADLDGCSSGCVVELGYTCPDAGSDCQPLATCGDGVRQSFETCDTGALNGTGGCDEYCQVVEGWRCLDAGVACQKLPTCGNGTVEIGEQCDDGAEVSGDGCSAGCQRETGRWSCPAAGGVCASTRECGNFLVEPGERCDDGNAIGGDGCDATCQSESGWVCRVPGQPCVPICGDGVVTEPESCDLGGVLDPGCVDCQLVPGYTCGTTACARATCGNGTPEPGEQCDDGDSNGLYFADGTGCSRSCTLEPTCRDGSGYNQACTTTCGDGNLEPGEDCDDGNLFDGDGCSATCAAEPGFTCTPMPVGLASPCAGDSGPLCMSLSVAYRDFKSTRYAGQGGHPDFPYMFSNYLTSTGASTGHKIICVPDGAGAARAAWGGAGDATARCTGLAQGLLVNGKMVFNSSRPSGSLCSCHYTDWNQGEPHYPGYNFPLTNGTINQTEVQGTVDNSGASGKQRFYGQVQSVKDATSFAQWFTDVACTNPPTTPCNRKSLSALSLTETASGSNEFLYTSGTNIITTGFFPLDGSNPTAASWGEVPECNLAPYWYANSGSNFAGCIGPQYLYVPYPGAPAGSVANPPGGGMWFENANQITGRTHDAHFTSEVRLLFAYHGAESLKFFGDDDLWIFINGILVLDLGGTHETLPGQIDLSDPDGATPGFAHVQEAGLPNLVTGGVTTAERVADIDLGLEKGRVYEIAIFHADRRHRESNFQLGLAGLTATRSICTPLCGDGIVTRNEQCDHGSEAYTACASTESCNSDTAYGACTTACTWSTFCGDHRVDGPEECDDGINANSSYNAAGCGFGCKNLPRCGDGKLDAQEECDDGADNQDGLYGCSTTCTQNASFCGDGIVDGSEECDDGIDVAGRGVCGEDCTWGPFCGDGVTQLEDSELCDEGDANGQPDRCSATCGAPGICGDGVVQSELGEACDNGVNDGRYGGCMPDCALGPHCGDGVVQAAEGEACDAGIQNEDGIYGGCSSQCAWGPRCGDGVTQAPPEQCDDGNTTHADGCSASCMTEVWMPL